MKMFVFIPNLWTEIYNVQIIAGAVSGNFLVVLISLRAEGKEAFTIVPSRHKLPETAPVKKCE